MSVKGFIASAGVNQWRTTVRKALYKLGQPASLADRVLMQMRTESGGNPRAINNWDSNARRGTPSKGLMQVIDPTFRAYAHPDFNSNIYDPMSNILASMRYAISRYGSLTRAYRGVGYAAGTDSAKSGWAVVGEQGPELVNFSGGQQVFNRDQTMRLAKIASSAPSQRQVQPGLSGPVVVNVIDRDGSFVERMRGEIAANDSHHNTRARMGVGRRG